MNKNTQKNNLEYAQDLKNTQVLPPGIKVLAHRNRKVYSFLFSFFILLCFAIPIDTQAQASACLGPPDPDPLCSVSDVMFNIVINLDDETLIWDENHPTLGDVQSFTQKAKITGTGTIKVPESFSLKLTDSDAVLYIEGPDLIVNGGSLILDSDGSRFIMNGGALRTFSDFQQKTETVVCLTGTKVEIGEEDADDGFTEGQFTDTGNLSNGANWQNDGGYRYLKDVCANVTSNYQLESSGSGTGVNGVDVIIGSCFEVGDEGPMNATETPFQEKDDDDSGDFQSSNRMIVYNSDIILANGNFQHSDKVMTLCNVDVKVNVSGNFDINSGTLEGQGLCLAIENVIQNSGIWTADVDSWFSFMTDEIVDNSGNLSGNIPANETEEDDILAACFTQCCIIDDGTPQLAIVKSVTTATGTCGVDDVEQLMITTGDQVKYCYVITNAGDATLFDVQVVDDNGTPGNVNDDFIVSLSGLSDLDGDGDLGDLEAGGTATGEALVTISSAGTVVNIAKATGKDSDGGDLEDEDDATVIAEDPPMPAIDIQKTVYKGHDIGASCPGVELVVGVNGEAVTYCFVVTNTGNTFLSNIEVNDPDLSGLVGTIAGPLAPGASANLFIESTIDGDLVNTATATGNPTEDDGSDIPGLDDVSDMDDAEVDEVAPAIDIQKTVYEGHDGGASCPGVELVVGVNGTSVTYCFVVTNTGDTFLSNIEVNDPDLGGVIGTIAGPLAPGASETLFSESTIDGDLVNTATATGNPTEDDGSDIPGLDDVSDMDDAEVDEVAPAIDIQKTVYEGHDGGASCPGVELVVGVNGTSVTYCFVVTNTGDTFLSDIEVTDPDLGGVIGTIAGPLAPGASETLFSESTIDGDLVNTATATGNPTEDDGSDIPGLDDVSDMDDAEVDEVAPAIDIQKTVYEGHDGGASCPGVELVVGVNGTSVTYCFVVTNTGDTFLSDIEVTDPDLGGVIGTIAGPLAPGASETLFSESTIDGDLVNTATATGNPTEDDGSDIPGLDDVSDMDDAEVDEVAPAIDIQKTVYEGHDGGASCPGVELVVGVNGTSVTYCFVVTNTGDTFLSNIEVNDPDLGGVIGTIAGPLAPGASETLFSESTIDGDLVNTATATGNPTEDDGSDIPGLDDVSDMDDAEVDEVAPAIDIQKTVYEGHDGGASCPGVELVVGVNGTSVTYCFVVTNTGDTFLSNIEVNDPDLGGVIGTIAGPLAPGARETLFSESTIDGDLVNTATATGNPTEDDGSDIPGLDDVSDMDDAEVDEVAPAIDIQKTVYEGHDGGASCPGVELVVGVNGTSVTYCFVVTNTGDTFLSDIEVTDPDLGGVIGTIAGPLAPGASETLFSESTIDGDLVNTATATGNPTEDDGSDIPGLDDVSDMDDAEVDEVAPAIDIQKTVYEGHDGGASCPGVELVVGVNGTSVTYCFVVTNTGDTFLSDIEVTDPDLGGVIGTIAGPLAPGASETLFSESTIDGDLVNTATATGNPTEDDGSDIPGLPEVEDDDTAEVKEDEVACGTCLVSGPDGPVCPETEQTFTAPISGICDNPTYMWMVSGNGIISQNNGASIVVTAGTAGGDYEVTLTIECEGCAESSIDCTPKVVSVSALPDLTPQDVEFCPERSFDLTSLQDAITMEAGTFEFCEQGASSGPFIYVPNRDANLVRVIDLATNTTLTDISVGQTVQGISLNPSGDRAYTANFSDNTVSVIDLTTNTELTTVPVGDSPISLSVNPAGDRVYVANQFSDNVTVIDATTNTVITTITGISIPQGVLVSPSGALVYVTSIFGSISVIDASTNTITGTITGVGPASQFMALTPDGSQLYVTNRDNGTVSVVNTATNTVITTITVGSFPSGITINPAGDKIYVTNSGGNSVSVIDVATNTVITTIPVGTFPFGVSTNTTGDEVYALNFSDGTVSVIDATNNSVTTTITGAGTAVQTRGGNFFFAGGGGAPVVIDNPDVYQPEDGGEVIVKFTSSVTGCTSQTTITFTQDPTPPIANAGPNAELTCEITQLTLDGTGSTGGGMLDYMWTTDDGNIVSGANTAMPVIDQAGTYTLKITDNEDGCTATDDVVITQDILAPTAEAGASAEITCNVLSITLDGSGSNGQSTLEYSWSTTDGNIVSGATTAMPVVDAAGTYTLEVKDTDNGCTATDDVVITKEVCTPGILIEKTVYAGHDDGVSCPGSELVVGENGDAVTYCFEVTNTGNTFLSDIVVNDPDLGGLIGTNPGPLAPGASFTLSAEASITGNLINTATATGNPTDENGNDIPDEDDAEDEDTAEVQELNDPVIDLVKEGMLDLGDDGIANPGDIITYTLTVTNNGNVTLSNVDLTDPLPGIMIGALSDAAGDGVGTLAVGDSEMATATYAITQADIDAGFVSNTATTTGDCPDGTVDCAEDDDGHDEPIPQAPGIDIQKTVYLGHDGGTTCPGVEQVSGFNGDAVTYCFLVTNNGNTHLTNIEVNDPNLGGLIGTIAGTLAPGETGSLFAESTIDGDLVNTATATGTPSDENGNPIPDLPEVEDDDTAEVKEDEVACGTCLVDGPEGPVCPSTMQTFTAPISGICDNPQYQWTVDGNVAEVLGNGTPSITVTAGAECGVAYEVSLTILCEGCSESSIDCTPIEVMVNDTEEPEIMGVPESIVIEKNGNDCVTFDNFVAGAFINSVSSLGGRGPILIYGNNPQFPGVNAAMIFDSDNPTPADLDLGSPNETFGGPGIGADGEFGMPFQNDKALGKVVIISNDLNQDVPDDEPGSGTFIEIDLTAIAPVTMLSVDVIDLEPNQGAFVELYNAGGALVNVVEFLADGNNGIFTLDLENTEDVAVVKIVLNGSGAVDNLCFFDPNDPELPEVPVDVTANDNCDGPLQVAFEEMTSDGDCPGESVVTRTWSAVDACGNPSSLTQTISIEDNEGPQILGIPGSMSITCLPAPPPITPIVIDNCDPDPDVSFEETIDGNQITRTWTATDACGNPSMATQIITITDDIAPQITCPANIMVQVPQGVPTTVVTYLAPVGTDNCDGAVTTLTSGLGSGADFPVGTTIEEYTVTDNAGLTASCTFNVTVVEGNVPIVTEFILIDADEDEELFALMDGGNYPIASLPTDFLSIRAVTSPEPTGSVKITVDGPGNSIDVTRTENVAPYSAYGDNAGTGDYVGVTFPIGTYTVTAMPFTGGGQSGDMGVPLTITFKIVDQLPCGDSGFSIFYADTDGDGFGDPNNTVEACSVPGGFVADNTDCDDTNDQIYPGATEICDGVDNNCDGYIDEGVLNTFYADTDGDGFGDPNNTVEACSAPAGFVADNTDCNDSDDSVYPGAAEVCDGVDNDCDGLVDADDPGLTGGLNTYYADTDNDGFGDPNNTVEACSPPAGFVTDNTDCDDTSDLTYPGAPEICDGEDNNCDGNTDEGVLITFYADTDGDGFGDPNNSTEACSAPDGFVADNTDCNDNNMDINPGAAEVCDGIDNDCDGLLDDNDPDLADGTTWYADTDGDGFGDPDNAIQACSMPNGYVADNSDCDDSNMDINPNATEVCDGVDNNCDGLIDGQDPQLDCGLAVIALRLIDADANNELFDLVNGAEYIQTDLPTNILSIRALTDPEPTGSVQIMVDAPGSDIDVTRTENVAPYSAYGDNAGTGDYVGVDFPLGVYTITATPYSGSNLSGDEGTPLTITFEIVDQPTQLFTVTLTDDGNGSTIGEGSFPANTLVTVEAFPDAMYQFASWTEVGSGNIVSTTNPYTFLLTSDEELQANFELLPCNGVGFSTFYADTDGDGFGDPSVFVLGCTAPNGFVSDNTDCNDKNDTVYPGAVEICDGLDNNCDGDIDEGLIIDMDGDGYPAIGSPCGDGPFDCNDDNPNINPGATDIPNNNIDEDCDGQDASGPSNFMDLELMVSADPPVLNQYSTIDFTQVITNQGDLTATNIKVTVPIYKDQGLRETGNTQVPGGTDLQYINDNLYHWYIPSLAPGQSLTLEYTLYVFSNDEALDYFTQVLEASPNDIDSTPGNDVDGTPNEDDEDLVVLDIPHNFMNQADLSNEERQDEELERTDEVQGGNQAGTLQLNLDNSIKRPEDLIFYPNPASTVLIVELMPFQGLEGHYHITDMLGQVVNQQRLGEVKDSNVRIDLTNLKSGMYILNVKVGDYLYSKKFLIQR